MFVLINPLDPVQTLVYTILYYTAFCFCQPDVAGWVQPDVTGWDTAFWFCQPDLAGWGSTRCNGLGCIQLINPLERVVVFAIFVVYDLIFWLVIRHFESNFSDKMKRTLPAVADRVGSGCGGRGGRMRGRFRGFQMLNAWWWRSIKLGIT